MTETRDRIVAATTELFRRRGYNGTSLKQITGAAAAPTGSLYHFFPGGKDDLARTVITTSGSAYRQLFELIADEAGDPGAAVSAFFDGAADTLADTDYIDACPIGTIAREVASTSDDLRQATADVFTEWVTALADRLVAAGMSRGGATDFATTVVAALEGGFVLARAQRDASLLRTTGRHMRTLVDAAVAAAVREHGIGHAARG
jgi:AcrR family transcriptional regulator